MERESSRGICAGNISESNKLFHNKTQVCQFVIRYKKKSTQRASIMSEFTVPASTPHAVKSCHPFLSTMRYITQLSPSAAGLIVISAFFGLAFFLIFFFQLITASRLLAPRARGFLSVIFPPPGNYVGAADQTREEAEARR